MDEDSNDTRVEELCKCMFFLLDYNRTKAVGKPQF